MISGTTVKAHTGSTKFGTYQVVTGVIREYVRRMIGPRHYTLDVVIVDAEGAEYVTGKGRIIEAVAPVAPVAPAVSDEPKAEAEREPRSLRFEKVRCGRCDGLGRRNDRGWGPNHKGVCYRCHGEGVALTANGYRAQQAFLKMRDERLGAAWGDLSEGEVFWYDGKAYEKGNHASLILRHETQVLRHHGPTTRAMWKEIAKRYKGATLVY